MLTMKVHVRAAPRTATRLAGAAMAATALLMSAFWPAGATEFSSVYTDLQKDCRAEGDDSDGGDVPEDCQGFDGYAVRISYSACTADLSISKGRFRLTFPSQYPDVENSLFRMRKLEWRLADGKPFAVIFRLDEYGFDNDRLVCDGRKKTGQVLVIKGLQGFTRIDHSLRVGKTPSINVEAQQFADHGFASGRPR
jgi:hypothetical protein